MAKKHKEIGQVAVIGTGRFGSSLIRTLAAAGIEVLAIDNNEAAINRLADIAASTIVADATEEALLESVDIAKYDAVVVCINESIEASALITLKCKQLGCPKIVAKAGSVQHKTILEKLGADFIIVPEIDSGRKLGTMLAHSALKDLYELSENYWIAELNAPTEWHEHTLAQLDFRRRFGVNVIFIKRNGSIMTSLDGTTTVCAGDFLLVGGGTEHIEAICKEC